VESQLRRALVDPQLKAQLNQTISVASLSSIDSYGKITYGSPAEVAARVELVDGSDVRSYFGGAPGGEYETRHVIITEDAIADTDHIWLPGDDDTNAALARRPLEVFAVPAENGAISHYETIL
jgi:hypothetical protein